MIKAPSPAKWSHYYITTSACDKRHNWLIDHRAYAKTTGTWLCQNRDQRDAAEMCGRFTSTASPEELMRLFGVTIVGNLQPRWNLAPSQSALVITKPGLHTEAIEAKWGLPPATSKHSFLINARMETASEKVTFRDAFAHNRCIIPASGWYEWTGPKKPWHIQRRDGETMAMGGLLFDRPQGKFFVVMTSAADGDLQNIHHRAPLVLPKDAWQSWLSGPVQSATNLCQAAPSDWFNWYRVTADVGKVALNHPGLVTPLSPEDIERETHDALYAEKNAHKKTAQKAKIVDDNQGNLFG